MLLVQHSNLVIYLRNVLKLIGVYSFVDSLRAKSCSLVTTICVGAVTLLSEQIDLIKLNITVILVIGARGLVLRLFLVTVLRSNSFILYLLSVHISA